MWSQASFSLHIEKSAGPLAQTSVGLFPSC
jgi:hypothetical protein